MKKILFIVLFIFTLADSYAKYFNAPIIIRHSNDESAFLNNATVTEIFKDSRGYMWFATDRALFAYGGVSPREFRYNFGRRNITDAVETFQEIFFLFDDAGTMACFDRRAECFLPVVYTNDLIKNSFNYFTFSGKSGFYAANSNGLFAVDFRIENRGGRDSRLVLTPRRVLQINMALHHVRSDSSGHIYAVERETLDVIRYNPTTGAVKTFDTDIKISGNVRNAYEFFVFDDTFWLIYYWNDMICYDMKEEQQILFDPLDGHNQLGVDFAEISKIVKLDDSNYCFATWNGVVNLKFEGRPSYDNYKVNFSPFVNDINGNFIEPRTTALFADKERHLLWTGTYGGGVVKYGDALDTYIRVPGSQIYSVTEDKRGYIWLTTAREGIMRSNEPRLDEKITFSPWTGSSFSRKQRYRMYNDGDRYLWFGDNSGTLIRVDQYSEEVSNYFVTLDGITPCLTRINGICTDSKGDLWIASDNRLLVWDQNGKKFENLVIDGLPHTRINHVIEDRQGTIWLGTEVGLYMLDWNGNEYKAFGGYEKMAGSEPSNVYALDINGKGDVVATYSDKLIRVGVLNKREVELYFSVDNGGLPSGHILKILDDRYGNTWFGTSTRIMTIRSGGNHIFTYSMTTSNRDGCRMRDGRLLWTAAEGLTYFNPEDAHREAASAKYVISRVKVHGSDVYTGQEVDGVEVFNESINDVQTLVFREGTNDFYIYVTDLSFTPFQKQVLYKLEPEMSEWVSRSTDLGLTFPGLKPGEYKLHVKPLFWNDTQGDEKIFTIIIKPAWYNSTLMRIVFLLVFIAGLWWVFIIASRRWQQFKHRQIHRVFDAINSNTDQDVVDAGVAENDEQRPKMLLVGADDELTAKITSIFDAEFDVRHSANSADALIDALFHLPSVIVCLFRMDDALVCCQRMKNNERTCPIPFIFVDTIGDPSDKIKSVEVRADDYVVYDGGEDSFMLRQVVDNRVAGRDALHQIYSRILTERQSQHGDNLDVPQDASDRFTQSVNEMIEQNIRDAEFSVKSLSELMGMSQSTLYRRLLAASGKTVIEAIRDARLRRAAELLYEGKLTIQSISEEVGYLDVATFRKHFVELYGVNPSRFGKKQ